MPRLFSAAHRARQVRDPNDPLYHGDYCEEQYLLGMKYLEMLQSLRLTIKYKRNATETLRKQKHLHHETFWRDVRTARNLSTPLHELIRRYNQVQVSLHSLRFNYRLAFMINRGFDRAAVIREFSGYLGQRGRAITNPDVVYDMKVAYYSNYKLNTNRGELSVKDFGKHINYPYTETFRLKGKA